MSEGERVRVLKMVAAGTISPEEANDVLESLEPGHAMPPAAAIASAPPLAPNRASRSVLMIEVSDGEKHVCVRIPTGLAQPYRQILLRPAMPFLEQWDVSLEELASVADQFSKGTTLLSLSQDEQRIEVTVDEP